MKKRRCPYCGGEILLDATDCRHCRKPLVKKQDESKSKTGLTSLSSWEGKRVPSWAVYLIVGITLFCCLLIGLKGCESAQPEKDETAFWVAPAAGENPERWEDS